MEAFSVRKQLKNEQITLNHRANVHKNSQTRRIFKIKSLKKKIIKKKKAKPPSYSVGYNSECDTSPLVTSRVYLNSQAYHMKELGNKCQFYLKYYQKEK